MGEWGERDSPGREVSIGYISEQVTTCAPRALIPRAHFMPQSCPTRRRRELGVDPPISMYHRLRTTLRNALDILPSSVGNVCMFFCVEVLMQKVTSTSGRQAWGGHAWGQ